MTKEERLAFNLKSLEALKLYIDSKNRPSPLGFLGFTNQMNKYKKNAVDLLTCFFKGGDLQEELANNKYTSDFEKKLNALKYEDFDALFNGALAEITEVVLPVLRENVKFEERYQRYERMHYTVDGPAW